MMMPANFSAVAENEMTYVVGGSLVDVLAPVMTTANWQNVSANVIKIVGNAYLNTHVGNVLTKLFDGNYVPGDVIGYGATTIGDAYSKGYGTFCYLHSGQQLHRSGSQGRWHYPAFCCSC